MPLVWQRFCQPDLAHVEPLFLQLLQRANRGELATNHDPHVHPGFVFGQQGVHQIGKALVVLVPTKEAEGLVLKQQPALGRFDQGQHVFLVIVRGKERPHLNLPSDLQRLEIPRLSGRNPFLDRLIHHEVHGFRGTNLRWRPRPWRYFKSYCKYFSNCLARLAFSMTTCQSRLCCTQQIPGGFPNGPARGWADWRDCQLPLDSQNALCPAPRP